MCDFHPTPNISLQQLVSRATNAFKPYVIGKVTAPTVPNYVTVKTC